MGTHGWKVRAEYAELRGEVTDFGFSGGLFGDKDWLLFVKPAPGYERLLENFVGHRNASGVVECEIEPPDRIAGQDAETAGVAAKYFAPLMGQQVAVRGVWVTDCSHTWDNRDPVFPVCDDGRTEIHPIYAIEVEHPSPGTGVRRVEVFVFSDSSGGTKPPHAGESIKETFRFVVPGPATSTRPRLRFVSETDMARSRRISLLRGGGETTLEVTIESGRERDSPTRGFYHAVADLDSVGLPAPGTLAAYGSTVKLMHASTGVALHSHAHAYGQAGASGQQQVTGYAGDDDNDLWRIKGPHGSPASHKAAQPVRHGDVLRLEHVLTQRNLHSHAGHLSPATSQQEVTGFGVRGAGDGNDDWRLEVEGDVAGGGAWDSAKRVRLVHAPTGCALHSHAGWAHPQWTLGQQEVTGFAGRDDNDWWQLAEVRAKTGKEKEGKDKEKEKEKERMEGKDRKEKDGKEGPAAKDRKDARDGGDGPGPRGSVLAGLVAGGAAGDGSALSAPSGRAFIGPARRPQVGAAPAPPVEVTGEVRDA